MILFTICLAILYVISLTRKSPITILSKDKSNAVKGVLAILIVFHHFSTTCDISSFSEFRRWGGNNCVCVFLHVGLWPWTLHNIERNGLFVELSEP